MISDKKIKVNIFSAFPPYQDGIATYAEELSSTLEDKINVKRVNKLYWKLIPIDGALVSGNVNKQSFPFTYSYFYLKPRDGNKIIHHFHASSGYQSQVILKDFFKLKGKKVLTVHEPFFVPLKDDKENQACRNKIIENCDAVIVHTEMLKAEISKSNKNVYLIPHGVNTTKYTSISKDTAKKILGLKGKVITYIGFIFPHKGINDFIQAVKDVDAEILIVGSGPQEIELKKLAHKICPDKIKFIPYVSDSIYPTYVRATDILVAPRQATRGECSGTMIQAMAAECVIVAYDIGCFHEYLKDEKGYLVEPGNIAELKNNIIEALSNKTRAYNAFQFARKNLEWSVIAEKHTNLYRSLL